MTRLVWGTVQTDLPSPYDQVKHTAMSVPCPVEACGAKKWLPCVTAGNLNLPYHLTRLAEALRVEMPHITDGKEERKLLRRRWEKAM